MRSSNRNCMMYSHADFRSKICVYLWNLWDTKRVNQKNLRYLRNLRDLIKCGFSSLDRTGRFPSKFRA